MTSSFSSIQGLFVTYIVCSLDSTAQLCFLVVTQLVNLGLCEVGMVQDAVQQTVCMLFQVPHLSLWGTIPDQSTLHAILH